MTRINIVHPSELTDQHLFSEFREIKMIPKALARSIKAHGTGPVLKRVPPKFTLNKGHVMFFYDKGYYLENRFEQLCAELRLRKLGFNEEAVLDDAGVFESLDERFWQDYEPTPEAYIIIRARIREKLNEHPNWYRYYGKLID